MRIRTVEDDFDWQIHDIIRCFVEGTNLAQMNAEQLQNELFKGDNALEFGRMVLNRCSEYSGDEIFELNN